MSNVFDFVTVCRPGMVLRTRDRRDAAILRVEPAEGLIHGEVRLFGSCVWQRDGRYRDAAVGVSGPLDLVPPGEATSNVTRPTASMREALDPANRPFCCD